MSDSMIERVAKAIAEIVDRRTSGDYDIEGEIAEECARAAIANVLTLERERCAQMATAIGQLYRTADRDPVRSAAADEIAAAIRASPVSEREEG